ncbi:MAG: hypothetical protein D3926_09700 [Desulfobacteraceae bacterium]|mgnify:CR=1 FL=1|nr:MAG: hypothetical protein D3926_09700 [Desulfobacteraceae bacterium]
MADLNYGSLTLTLLFFITIAIYVLIIIIFMTARRKYQGGVIEKVINMIISTIGFMLVSDIALLLAPVYGFDISYQVHVVFKIIAMTLLATGGLKFFIR